MGHLTAGNPVATRMFHATVGCAGCEQHGETSPRGKVWSQGSRWEVGATASWGARVPSPGCFTMSGKQALSYHGSGRQRGARSPTLAVWRKRAQGRAHLEDIGGSWVLFPGCQIFFWQAGRRHAVSPATQPMSGRGRTERLQVPRLHTWAPSQQGEDGGQNRKPQEGRDAPMLARSSRLAQTSPRQARSQNR